MKILNKELAKCLYSSYTKGRNSSEPSFLYFSINPEGDSNLLLDDSSVYIGSIGLFCNQAAPLFLEADLILDMNHLETMIQPYIFQDAASAIYSANNILFPVCFTELYCSTSVSNTANIIFVCWQFRKN